MNDYFPLIGFFSLQGCFTGTWLYFRGKWRALAFCNVFCVFAYILVFVDALGARSFQNIYRLAGIYCENVCKRILLVTRLIQLPVRFCACYMREVLRKRAPFELSFAVYCVLIGRVL